MTPSKVENLLVCYWDNGTLVKENLDTIEEIKQRVKSQLSGLRTDHKRMLNPTPYKVYIYIYKIDIVVHLFHFTIFILFKNLTILDNRIKRIV